MTQMITKIRNMHPLQHRFGRLVSAIAGVGYFFSVFYMGKATQGLEEDPTTLFGWITFVYAFGVPLVLLVGGVLAIIFVVLVALVSWIWFGDLSLGEKG